MTDVTLLHYNKPYRLDEVAGAHWRNMWQAIAGYIHRILDYNSFTPQLYALKYTAQWCV